MDPEKHDIHAARRAADRGELDEWVASFLASPGSDNEELGRQLSERVRHWAGPVRVPLDRLKRFAGPPGEPVLVQVDEEDWDDRVDDLADKVDDGMDPPPLIVTVADDGLHLEDGNHRVESLRRAGESHGWAVLGAADEQLLARFRAGSGSSVDPPGR